MFPTLFQILVWKSKPDPDASCDPVSSRTKETNVENLKVEEWPDFTQAKRGGGKKKKTKE